MKVRPVLVKNCHGCHTSTRMGGLQLDTREHALKGGNSGAAIIPGHADQSLLVQAITQRHEKFKMPPGGKLKDEEIAAIEAWINSGAAWPESKAAPATPHYVITAEQRSFWAFQPVRDVAIPGQERRNRPLTSFILAALEKRGLKPVRAAEKTDLIRRATFDLTGLPPSARRSQRLPCRQVRRRIRQSSRPAARLASLRRALGPLLAGHRALLRRPPQLHPGRSVSECLALSRLGYSGVQRGYAVRSVRQSADRRRPGAGV